jgi:hypothetical protein
VAYQVLTCRGDKALPAAYYPSMDRSSPSATDSAAEVSGVDLQRNRNAR